MELTAEKRQKVGKTTKGLAREGSIPAIIYGKGIESVPVVLKAVDYTKVYEQAGETDLIDVKIGKEGHKVLIRNTQFDPVTDRIIHAELYQPNLKEKTEAEIPVEVINEELNPLVKNNEGVVIQLLNEVRVKALPADLPHNFVVDASKFEKLGDGVTIAQLDYDKTKVEVVDVDPEEMVAKLDKIEVEVEPVAEVTEAEAIAKVEASAEKVVEEEGNKAEGAKDTPHSKA